MLDLTETTNEIIHLTGNEAIQTANFLDFIYERTSNRNPILAFINDLRIVSPTYQQYLLTRNVEPTIAGLIANSIMNKEDISIINNYLRDKPLLC